MPQDTLENAAGESVKLTLGGREFAIRQFVLSDYQALRENMKAGRIAAFIAGGGALPLAERVAVLRDIASTPVTDDEMMAESVSMPGMVFMLWRQLVKTDPTITLAGMDKLVQDADIASLMAVLEGLNGPSPEDKQDRPLAVTGSGSTSASPS